MKTTNNVILIDDDQITNKVNSLMIKRTALEIDITDFTSARRALDFITSNDMLNNESEPAVILLDINMPGMNGWEFLEAFEKLDKNIQQHYIIYMLSSSIDVEDKQRALNNECVSGYLTKPIVSSDIEHIVCVSGCAA